MEIMELYQEWLNKTADNAQVYNELVSIKEDGAAIEDRFFKGIAFGTGGLRGKIGAGTNRMNVYTVGRATFGLADYILKNGVKRSVGIAYDSRNMSKEFARLVAEIMSSQGIEAYLFEELMPTPVLSYAVRKFGLGAGVVVTASHNPKEYNGYKVYNGAGCQITDDEAGRITAAIEQFGYFNDFKANEELIHILGEEVLDGFIDEIMNYSVYFDKSLVPSIVYSPLNGTGNKPVKKLFARLGLTDYTVVPEQENPDGNFPTCPFPNPEEKSALKLALALAEQKGAELVVATDPDADRVGIATLEKGEYRLLNGNETGILMENFLLEKKTKEGTLPKNPYIVKTIVTTDLAERIATAYGARTKNVLTGFKYIGEYIDVCPKEDNYIMGMEESYGYLVGTHARDKDAISAVMTIVEMLCYYRSKGQSLVEALEGLYEKYGYFTSALYYKNFEGKSGMEFMNAFMSDLRKSPWKEVGGEQVQEVKDYAQGIEGLPKSNVLVFNGEKFSAIIRPSGTEPKIKIYLTAKEREEKQSKALLEKLLNHVKTLL